MSVRRRFPPFHALLARTLAVAAGAAVLGACATAMPGQSRDNVAMELSPEAEPTYADLVTLALASDLVAIVTVDDQTRFPPERAPDLPPERVRLYLETLTRNLLVSPTGVGGSLVFVTDLAREPNGDTPDLEGQDFVIFADQVRDRPGEVQLVARNALFPAGPRIEGRVRSVLRQLAAADRPPQITGVRDVISVPGNLAGESETQMFVQTQGGTPVSLSVVRRPGMQPEWGVSLGEIVDTAARPPEAESLAWFRFACGLPRQLPDSAFLQGDRNSQARAREDYAFVLDQLGPCERRFT
ncbi:hypothetical protein GRI62_13180 [Erythrobacter arachoides]|uniref:Uncharacterized protein n=1 Tax=Aurantiacibacter arachoides TaxID=1850444 RepID=A0A845A1Y6_9SPHN|nr:hypothetical protein [Aurantiacibacter arachoides]MXO94551.1 hypothetical protein [Aurantiacibacter arachoides]GGD62605.1 hypothetical protein GCM10011411_23550 [Aurantiacibacter arachoides]